MFKIIALSFFFLINLGIIFYFFNLESSGVNTYMALGRITGLLGVYLILWELIFVSRLEFITKAFKSATRLARSHHIVGFLALLFIFIHPIFLAIAYGQTTGRNIIAQLVAMFSWEELPMAYLSLLVFIVAIVFSYRQIKKKYRYEFWYLIHVTMYLAIFWAFEHQLELGTDLQNTLFAIYWYLLYFIFFAALVLGRVLPPALNFYRHRFRVSKVVKENDFCTSVYITGRNLASFKFKSGQYGIFRFLNMNAWQAHPFSFSCVLNGEQLRITVKALGDFTKDLDQKIKLGDYVMVAGPYGDLVLPKESTKKLALIAGGIGVTPFFSMAQEAKVRNIDFKCIWSNSRRQDIILENELEAYHIISQEEGRINADKLKTLLPDYLDRAFYICGPKPMMAECLRILDEIGVNKEEVHTEKFSF